MYYHDHQRFYPCLHCQPVTYIRMVQHLIEICLLLHMSLDQCMQTLAQHANIRPVVTLTVWRELQKENKDFFRAYYYNVMCHRPFMMRRRVQRAPSFKRRHWTQTRRKSYRA